jgi:ribosome-associated toxin RatA of RatAB toxin-antitoxin module
VRDRLLHILSFRSRLFENLVGGLFARAVERYTAAFEARADAVFGRNGGSGGTLAYASNH